MEQQSKRRRRLRRSPPPPQYGAGDRISALPDDMLLQVILRLRCARAPARTGLLSRRWRGLWPRLPGLTFRDVTAAGIKSALAHVPRRTSVSLLEIRPSTSPPSSAESRLDNARAKSLLRSAARLSPEEVVFVLPRYCQFNPRRAVTMTAYESAHDDVEVHSVSLEEIELPVHAAGTEQSIHIVTPLLKQLKLSSHGKTNLSVSISAPMMEKVSWYHRYASMPLIFGFWWLRSLNLETIESHRQKDGVLKLNNDEEIGCSHLPHVYNVLSMEISPYVKFPDHPGFTLDFAFEMEKLLITNFSVFELHLDADGHAIGAFLLRLLSMHHIRVNTRKLKIILSGRFQMPERYKCFGNCPSCESKDWRNESISLTRLEEVEIKDFSGGDQEIDFVTSIFGWAPMLKRLIIKLPYGIKQSEIGGCATKIYNICLANPYVNCFVYLYSGEKWSLRHD